MVSALRDKYRIDLTMFEYDVEEYTQIASDSEGFMPDLIWDQICPLLCDILFIYLLNLASESEGWGLLLYILDISFCDAYFA